MTTIQAVFEKGIFRPTEPVVLDEGTSVTVLVESEQTLKPPQPMIAVLAEIAAMPSEGPNDGFSGADHDQVLYGPNGAR